MIIATLLLLIPLSMVKSQIKERGNTMQESIYDMTASPRFSKTGQKTDRAYLEVLVAFSGLPVHFPIHVTR